MYKKSLFLSVLCMHAFLLHAYVYQAIVMRKLLPEQQRYHTVIMLGDFHDTICEADSAHKATVAAWAKQSGNRAFRIITEDADSANVHGRRVIKGAGIVEFVYKGPVGGFLTGITPACRDAGSVALNLEYRYARLMSLGPIGRSQEDPRKKLDSFFVAKKLLMSTLIQEVEDELVRIAAFRDGRELDQWYASEIESIRAAMRTFGWHSYARESIAAYLSGRPGSLRTCIKNELIPFDKTILDMLFVHDIVATPGVDVTCVLAGGSHVERVSDRLKQVGYTVLFHAKPSYPFFDTDPYPIDMQKLALFFTHP